MIKSKMYQWCRRLPWERTRGNAFPLHFSLSHNKSQNIPSNPITVLTSWAKMLYEDFPQATIAMFYFGDCASECSTQTTVIAFNAFSMVSFAMFTVYVVTYFHNYVEMADRVMAYSITLFLQFLICLIGFIFAIISINKFN